jgi:hypothetical protein
MTDWFARPIFSVTHVEALYIWYEQHLSVVKSFLKVPDATGQ